MMKTNRTQIDQLINAEVDRLERLRLQSDAAIINRERSKVIALSCVATGAFFLFVALARGHVDAVGWIDAVSTKHFDRTILTFAIVLIAGAAMSYSFSLWASCGRSLALADMEQLRTVELACVREPRLRPIVARWMTYQPRLRRRDAQQFDVINQLLLRRQIAEEAHQNLERAHQGFATAVCDSKHVNETTMGSV
jgi:hypothetical protein